MGSGVSNCSDSFRPSLDSCVTCRNKLYKLLYFNNIDKIKKIRFLEILSQDRRIDLKEHSSRIKSY